VIDLSKIELATDEDKAYGIDQWAKLFKASTWEELKTMATQNPVFEDVAKSMFMYSGDNDVLEQCYKVEYDKKFVNHLSEEIKSLKASNADKDDQIADLTAKLAYLEAQQSKNK
jgi:NurA-like 5'-3' nuclease